MARARNLKPDFFRDSKVVSCCFESRLLFQGLWCLADYMGRLKYDPLDIKMRVFPADNVDIEKCMDELAAIGLIQIYRDSSGSALVQIRGFTKHQNPHMNERIGKDKKPLPHLPGPEDCQQEKPDEIQQVRDAVETLREYYQSDPADSLNLIPSSLKDSVPNGTGGEPPDPVKQIFDLGVSVLTNAGMKSESARALVGKLRKELGDGGALEAIKLARDKTDPQTFLGACAKPKLKPPADPNKVEAWAKENGLPLPRPGESTWDYRERVNAA